MIAKIIFLAVSLLIDYLVYLILKKPMKNNKPSEKLTVSFILAAVAQTAVFFAFREYWDVYSCFNYGIDILLFWIVYGED